MTLPRYYLADKELAKQITESGFQVCSEDQINELRTDDAEFVTVAYEDEAIGWALALSSRGVPKSQVSYVDLHRGDSVAIRCAAPKHLYWTDVRPLSELQFNEEDMQVYPSSIPFLDKDMRWGWRLPELGVIAGSYGSGKSTFGQFLAAAFANGPGRELRSGALLCSWEDIGWNVRNNIAKFESNLAQDDRDLQQRIHFVVRGANEDRLISWYMGLVEYHFERYGTRFFWLDPWNEMDHQKDSRQTETEYVRDIMKELRRLVDRLKIILIVATHVPAKMIKGNGEIEPFKIANSFGSSQFGNKADRGICILRAKKWDETHGHTLLRLDKAKIEGVMGIKKTLGLRFDPDRFMFEKDAYVTEAAKDIWRD